MSVTEEIRTSTKEARYTTTSRVRDYRVNRRLAIFLVAFLMGSVVSPAFATSYPGAWKKIFGHSTSCALGRASVNDSTQRGGALTSNFKGCSSSNAALAVPSGYLGARALIVNNSNGAVCGQSSTIWNSTKASSRDASTLRTSGSSSCVYAGYYFGRATNYRNSDSGVMHILNDRVSGTAVWMPAVSVPV